MRHKFTLLCILILSMVFQSMAWSQGATWARIAGGAGDGDWSDHSKWQDNSSGTFQPSTSLPGSNDTARISHNRTVILDMDAAIDHLLIVTSPGSGTLDMNTAGTTLSANTVTVVQSQATGNGVLNLFEGTLHQKGGLTVNTNGLLNISGGMLYLDDDQGIFSIDGTGKLDMTSGLIDLTANRYRINIKQFQISGGKIAIQSQVTVGQGGVSNEFRIVGDQPKISFGSLAHGPHADPGGTFYFELNQTGVSPVEVQSFMNLSHAKIVVDGSNYTGGTDTFLLFKSRNLAGLANPDNIHITGFAPSYRVSVYQDEDDNSVQLEIIQ